jgi:septal ring factor EnvC (AmiA/AmiB activator)
MASLVIGAILLGAIGLFLHTLVGNAIIIKNVEKDTTTSKKTEKELLEVEANIQQEELTLQTLQKELDKIHKKLDQL